MRNLAIILAAVSSCFTSISAATFSECGADEVFISAAWPRGVGDANARGTCSSAHSQSVLLFLPQLKTALSVKSLHKFLIARKSKQRNDVIQPVIVHRRNARRCAIFLLLFFSALHHPVLSACKGSLHNLVVWPHPFRLFRKLRACRLETLVFRKSQFDCLWRALQMSQSWFLGGRIANHRFYHDYRVRFTMIVQSVYFLAPCLLEKQLATFKTGSFEILCGW